MKTTIRLKELQLKNFKKFRELTVNFEGPVTEVFGRNGSGKTTIFDAFTWCLFGKDSADKTDSGVGAFELKTKEGAVVIPQIEHEVTATLEINGTPRIFRRNLTENWVQSRGKAEPVLKGNTTHYYINGIEKKESEYKQDIQSFIDEKLFKLITNPVFFPSLDWKTRREILLNIIGNVTLESVAGTSKKLMEVYRKMSGEDYDSFKDNIAKQISRIDAEKDKIQPEIDGVNSVMPDLLDWDTLEKEKAGVEKEISEIDARLGDIVEANRAKYDAIQKLQKEIGEKKLQQQKLVFDARSAERNRVYELNDGIRKATAEFNTTTRKFETYRADVNNEINRLNTQINAQQDVIKKAQERRQALLDEWTAKNFEEYKTDGEKLVCPLYNVLCSDASVLKTNAVNIAKAREAFYDNKNKELDAIEEKGQTINKEIEEAAEAIKRYQMAEAELKKASEKESADYNAELQRLRAIIDNTPENKEQPVNPETLPGYLELVTEIKSIEEEIRKADDGSVTDNAGLTARKSELVAKADGIKGKLALRIQREYCQGKIEKLKAREKELAQQKADLQKEEFEADELNHLYIDEIKNKVNNLFNYVQFEMFEKQLNGGERPVCNILVNGINYNGSLNDGAKINAGLEIIQVLCDYYNISAPIFIDGAEKITDWHVQNESQKILLTAQKNTELTIK